MKISELVQRTNVPKETIHYYIREGLLRKPRKTGKNTVQYNDSYIEHIRTIKGLQDNYFLPLSVIKKIMQRLKKETPSKRSAMQLLSEHFRPLDHLLSKNITGKGNFMEKTGLGEKWLNRMTEWGILSPDTLDGVQIYSSEDIILGKLLVDMDNLGFGPRDGYDPALLKRYSDFFSEFISKSSKEYLRTNSDKLSEDDYEEKGARYTEIMGLFFYYLYRKLVRGNFIRYFTMENKTSCKQDQDGI